MKKLHYLADALTLCEVIAGVTLLGMTFLKVSADYAIWIFISGELCDAFDGPCARRWPYPDDGKKRWWREHVVQIEHASDIFLAVVCMLYLSFATTATIAAHAFMLGLAVIIICVCIELFIIDSKNIAQLTGTQRYLDYIILVRRWLYTFIGIGGGVYLLIMATSWILQVKLIAIGVGIGIGCLLFFYKLDRAFKP